MKNNNIPKLNFLLLGLSSRLSENMEYFVSIRIDFLSGIKKFSAIITLEDGVFFNQYNGVKKEIRTEAIFKFITEEAKKYDSVEINYQERGYALKITADDKNVKSTKSEEKIPANVNISPLLTREYIINPAIASDLLAEIGVIAENGKIKNDMIRKYNQIDRFIELIEDMFDFNKKELIIIDCCCGKSYLSFVINFYLREIKKKKCRFICIDIKEDVIADCKAKAKRLGYNNMEFLCENLNFYEPVDKIDMVLSLHACDTATDLAIALGLKCGANSIVCVPCCHKELQSKCVDENLAPILKHPILKNRFTDIVTDGLRGLKMESCGYDVTIMEYISPLDTPKNIMIKGKKTAPCNASIAKSYDEVTKYLKCQPSNLRLL